MQLILKKLKIRSSVPQANFCCHCATQDHRRLELPTNNHGCECVLFAQSSCSSWSSEKLETSLEIECSPVTYSPSRLYQAMLIRVRYSTLLTARSHHSPDIACNRVIKCKPTIEKTNPFGELRIFTTRNYRNSSVYGSSCRNTLVIEHRWPKLECNLPSLPFIHRRPLRLYVKKIPTLSHRVNQCLVNEKLGNVGPIFLSRSLSSWMSGFQHPLPNSICSSYISCV